MEYTTKLKEHIAKYSKNFDKMEEYKAQGKDYTHLLFIENELNEKGKVIRKALGIYAMDPCAGMPCISKCLNPVNCKMLSMMKR